MLISKQFIDKFNIKILKPAENLKLNTTIFSLEFTIINSHNNFLLIF
jgi:hypothetical protein